MLQALGYLIPVLTGLLAAGAMAADAAEIAIDGMVFTPAKISVRQGGTVRWVNRDRIPHVIALGDEVRSPVLAPGESFEWTFSRPGTFAYGCRIHPGMEAELTVESSRN